MPINEISVFSEILIKQNYIYALKINIKIEQTKFLLWGSHMNNESTPVWLNHNQNIFSYLYDSETDCGVEHPFTQLYLEENSSG